MARVVVTSCMYLGDVAPFIPVARRLHDAGHEVTFVAPEGFRSLLAPEPFAFHPYGLDASPRAMDADPRHAKLMRHPMRNAARLGRYWVDLGMGPAAVDSLRDAFAGADVVVTHPTMGLLTVPAARAAGARVVVGQLFPMMIPTARWTPPLGDRSPDLGRVLNRGAWSAMRAMTALTMRDREINAVRRSLGQPPLRGNAGWAWTEADRTVVLASPHWFGPGADDWPPVTWGGFSLWRGPDGQALDPALDRYVADGDPPVLVTLGTAAATGAGDRFARMADDLDRDGLRPVLLVGHESNLGPLGDHPGAAAFAPITELLPRCAVAVVSGALGGMAAALSAGVPVVVHPTLFDQLWNARRVEELGVGLVARRVGDVAPAVRRIAREPAFGERARRLAAAMADEDGPEAVLDAVGSLA